jgi:predicted phage replisome organizer
MLPIVKRILPTEKHLPRGAATPNGKCFLYAEGEYTTMAKYDATKFYWLQLKEDFFDEDAIDWLEEQPNGKEYSLFYLKLCLKSLRTNGVLIRRVGNMLVPYDHTKLGELTKTNPDTVMVAMNLLINIGLVQKLENGELYLTQVENMIGSQSKSAFKKQQQRITRQKEIAQIEGGQEADNCPPDIEKEIEIELEEEIEIEPEAEKKKGKAKRFTKPTLADIQAYCIERNNNVDAERFYDYYEANGWKVGKNSMKDWKASVRTWERNGYSDSKPKATPKQDEGKWAKANAADIIDYPF